MSWIRLLSNFERRLNSAKLDVPLATEPYVFDHNFKVLAEKLRSLIDKIDRLDEPALIQKSRWLVSVSQQLDLNADHVQFVAEAYAHIDELLGKPPCSASNAFMLRQLGHAFLRDLCSVTLDGMSNRAQTGAEFREKWEDFLEIGRVQFYELPVGAEVMAALSALAPSSVARFEKQEEDDIQTTHIADSITWHIRHLAENIELVGDLRISYGDWENHGNDVLEYADNTCTLSYSAGALVDDGPLRLDTLGLALAVKLSKVVPPFAAMQDMRNSMLMLMFDTYRAFTEEAPSSAFTARVNASYAFKSRIGAEQTTLTGLVTEVMGELTALFGVMRIDASSHDARLVGLCCQLLCLLTAAQHDNLAQIGFTLCWFYKRLDAYFRVINSGGTVSCSTLTSYDLTESIHFPTYMCDTCTSLIEWIDPSNERNDYHITFIVIA